MTAVAELIAKVNSSIINPILALLFSGALLIFLWGGFVFVISAGNDEARANGRRHMLWGIIGMTIMVSVFALLRIGLNTFGVSLDTLPAQHPLR